MLQLVEEKWGFAVDREAKDQLFCGVQGPAAKCVFSTLRLEVRTISCTRTLPSVPIAKLGAALVRGAACRCMSYLHVKDAQT